MVRRADHTPSTHRKEREIRLQYLKASPSDRLPPAKTLCPKGSITPPSSAINQSSNTRVCRDLLSFKPQHSDAALSHLELTVRTEKCHHGLCVITAWDSDPNRITTPGVSYVVSFFVIT